MNGDWKRTCDRCGYNGPFRDLTPVGDGKFHCRDDRDSWTAEQTAKHRLRRKPIVIRPRKNARYTNEVPLYQQDEAELFNFVCKYAVTASVVGPTGAIVTAATAGSAAECGVYLRELLIEDKRPLRWMTQGLAALRSIGDFLLTKQYGSLTGPSPSEGLDSVLYGYHGATASNFPVADAAAGLTYLGLYQLTGETGWLDAADRVAWYLRQSQRTDLLTANFTADSGGNRFYVGGWNTSISTGKVPSGLFSTAMCWTLYFLARYRAQRGDGYSLGSTSATGDYSSPPAGTVQQTIDDALAFYVTGKWPYSTTTSTPIAPLSSVTPQWSFQPNVSARFTVSSSGAYFGIPGRDFALALRGLYELEGYSARVATIFEWLMSFTSNTAFELTDGVAFATPLNVVAAGAKGTYDPTVAMADFLGLGTAQAETPTTTINGSTYYSQVATAILGPVYNASNRILRTWKDALGVDRKLPADPRETRSLRRYDLVGLSFQATVSSTTTTTVGVAARNALIYRASPGAFNELRGVA